MTYSEVDPEFRARCNEIINDWQEGKVEFSEAAYRLDRLKKEAHKEGNFAHIGGVELVYGILQAHRGYYDSAIQHFEQARQNFLAGQLHARVNTTILNLGEIYRQKGDFLRARQYFHQAYEGAVKLGTRSIQMNALSNEAQMLISLNGYTKAHELLKKALQIGTEPFISEPDPDHAIRKGILSEIHYVICNLYIQENKPVEAWEHAQEAHRLAQEVESHLSIAFATRAIGDVITRLPAAPEGYDENPDTYYQIATQLFRDLNSESEIGRTYYAQAQSMVYRKMPQEAARLFEQAIGIFTKLGMTDDVSKATQAKRRVL